MARESHDFWVRNLLGGKLPDVVIAIETHKTEKVDRERAAREKAEKEKADKKKREKDKERERTP